MDLSSAMLSLMGSVGNMESKGTGRVPTLLSKMASQSV